ncbi:MAG: hypothetical protein MJA83_04905, partial [Gammaproteobacteria bacterium]|nr:hypothetical protein [Gammaproteobacteria bacterium]
MNLASAFADYLPTDIVKAPDLQCHSMSMGGSPKTKSITFSASFAGEWEIIKGISLTSISLNAEKQQDSKTGDISAYFKFGELYLDIQLEYAAEDKTLILTGTQDEGESIDLLGFLAAIAKSLGISLPTGIPKVMVEQLEFSIDLHSHQFSLTARDAKSSSINFFSTKKTGSRWYSIEIDPSTKHKSFKVVDWLVEDDSGIEIYIELGSDGKKLTGSWYAMDDKSLGLTDILQKLDIPANFDLPKGLDFQFDKISFELERANKETCFRFYNETASLLISHGTNTEYALSLIIGDGIVDTLKALVPVLPGNFNLPFERLLAAYSSSVQKNFTFPSDAQSGHWTLPASLPKGLTLLGEWDIAKTPGDIFKNLHALIPESPLGCQFTIGKVPKLGVDFDELAIKLAGQELKLDKPVLDIGFSTPPHVTIGGDMSLPIGSVSLDLVVGLTISAVGVSASCGLKFDIKNGVLLHNPLGMKGVDFIDADVGLQISTTPPSMSLMCCTKFAIGDDPAPDAFDFAFDLV